MVFFPINEHAELRGYTLPKTFKTDYDRIYLVGPFRGLGFGRLLRLPHCTVSKCKDGTLRVTFIVKDSELRNFCRYLMEEIPQVLTFMYDYLEGKKGLIGERTCRRKAA